MLRLWFFFYNEFEIKSNFFEFVVGTKCVKYFIIICLVIVQKTNTLKPFDLRREVENRRRQVRWARKRSETHLSCRGR